MNKIISKFNRNGAKLRGLFVSSIAGIFSGVAVSFLITEFNGDLNNIIILAVFFILLIFLYFLGAIIVSLLFKKEVFPYILNFFAGLVSSSFIGLAVKYRTDSGQGSFLWIVGIESVVIFLIAAHFLVGIKRSK